MKRLALPLWAAGWLALGVGVLGLTSAGCETLERPLPKGAREVAPREPADSEFRKKEEELLEAADDEPEDPKVWFELARFYEEHFEFRAAAQSYELFHEKTEAIRPDYFTAGHYHLGRIYARLKQWQVARFHLNAVIALKPDDEMEAVLNPHFRESHWLLAAIYFEHGQLKPAYEHVRAYQAYNGQDPRAEEMLAELLSMREEQLIREGN